MNNQLDTFLSLFVSRHDDFALQLTSGLYRRAGRALSPVEVYKHLTGEQTIGVYLISEHGTCINAVFDSDTENGLDTLHGVQERLARDGIASYLEQSRRGGHLWVFLAAPAPASQIRRWLLPYCPEQTEFYPKQDEGKGYGSLIRLPFGVHHRSGKRYPFVTWIPDGYVPVAPSVRASLDWLTSVQRVTIPDMPTPALQPAPQPDNKKKLFSSSYRRVARNPDTLTIRAWCAEQDPYTLIGRYVDLDTQGIGCCPFGWHHEGGSDQHASFKVYSPGVPGGYCWYCYSWQQGGSVFDFLRHYYNFDARTLWLELQKGGQI